MERTADIRSIGRTITTAVSRFLRALNSYRALDWAAALTYYGVLSLFPALIVGTAVLGVFGVADALLDQVAEFAPGAARDTLESILREVQGLEATSGTLVFVLGLATALWAASGYVSAFERAAQAIMGSMRTRSRLKQVLSRLGVTVALLGVLLVVTLMLVLSGPVAENAARLVGLGSDAPGIWSIVKWPIVLAAMGVAVSLLTLGVRPARTGRVRLITFGGLIAVAIWALCSAAFSFYVARIANYSRLYGSLAGIVIFLVWMWLSNLALVIGVMIDAARFRRRATVVRP